MNNTKERVSLRQWLVFIFVGLAGQFAWSIENMYLNSYLYYLNMNAQAGQGFNSSLMVALTTALSAITATVTTIFMGSLTDKVRKRKIFISLGYILWGIATSSFGLLDVGNAQSIVPISMAASTAAILVIVIDCVMTFLGSTANDAAFNSYVTKNVRDENRGKVEGVLSILPLVAMLIIFVALNGLTANGQWDLFFYVVGAIVILVGIVSFFLVPKEKPEKPSDEKFLPILAEGFRPSTVKANKSLYLVLLCYFVYGVAIQVFFPYLMVYVERTVSVPNSGSSFLTPFAIVMAVALLLGSAGSVLIGFLSDKKGKIKMILPTCAILGLGLLMLFFAPDIASDTGRYAYTAIAGLVMILGYVAVPTILNSLVRDYIPKGKEGSFMGVRMLFVVALPMCIGPFIGDALNQATGQTYVNEYDIVSALPSKFGYIAGLVLLLLIVVPYFFLARSTRYEKNNGYLVASLLKNGEELPAIKRGKKHPRPSFRRKSFVSLEGEWDYCITKDDALPEAYDGKIQVPFAIESPLSGVNHLLMPEERLFYHRKIVLDSAFYQEHVFLCFEGVDQFADVFVDGKHVCSHEGGYTRFRVDVRPYLSSPSFELVVRVRDRTDSSYLMTGKQRLTPNGWFYSSSSGIVKSVYLESAGKAAIDGLVLVPDFENKCVHVTVRSEVEGSWMVEVGEESVEVQTGKTVAVPLIPFRPWSIEDPYLYDVHVFGQDDEVFSYFGVRAIEVGGGKDGKRHIYLNGRKIFLNGLLDQGYYQGGGLTAPDESLFLKDIQNAKALGFNCLRMHVKVEEDRFYYLAAKEGIFLIQDIPNGGEHIPFFNVVYPRASVFLFNRPFYLTRKGYGRRNAEGCKKFIDESLAILKDLAFNPAIVVVTIFNEAWGQFDPEKLYSILKREYPQFLFDTASGWLDTPKSDLFSIHSYTVPHLRRKRGERPYVLTEIGGASLKVAGHYLYPKVYGHYVCRSEEAFQKRYRKLYEGFYRQIEDGSLNGLVYTQLNDCETEANGIYTLDRAVLKLPCEMVKTINGTIARLAKE